jgi:hypothetical protein
MGSNHVAKLSPWVVVSGHARSLAIQLSLEMGMQLLKTNKNNVIGCSLASDNVLFPYPSHEWQLRACNRFNGEILTKFTGIPPHQRWRQRFDAYYYFVNQSYREH